MSRKQRKHIRGKRGEKFLQIVRDIDRARILCVSLDIRKYFHLVMMHNAYGEIVTPSFEIDIFRSGFEHLCQVIDETAARIGADRPCRKLMRSIDITSLPEGSGNKTCQPEKKLAWQSHQPDSYLTPRRRLVLLINEPSALQRGYSIYYITQSLIPSIHNWLEIC